MAMGARTESSAGAFVGARSVCIASVWAKSSMAILARRW